MFVLNKEKKTKRQIIIYFLIGGQMMQELNWQKNLFPLNISNISIYIFNILFGKRCK
jgi:hypothetical protein